MSDHLFILGSEIMHSVSEPEIAATVAALEELGLYRLPYNDKVVVRIPSEEIGFVPDRQTFPSGTPMTVINRFFASGMAYTQLKGGEVDFDLSKNTLRIYYGGESYTQALGAANRKWISDMLITLLATKNTVKHTKVDKLARLGIGKNKHRHHYVTTITLPGEHTIGGATGTGGRRRPHLRRGHIRDQRYGPQLQFTRKVFIEAMFIHADEGFVNDRAAYNVTKRHVT